MTRLHPIQSILLIAGVLCISISLAKTSSDERAIEFQNHSGSRVEVYWMHPQTGEAVLQSKPFVKNGGVLDLNSYAGHVFQLREMPSTFNGACDEGECKMSFAIVTENEEHIVFINSGVSVEHVDDKTKARGESEAIISSCAANYISPDDPANANVPLNKIGDLTECIESHVAERLHESNEEVRFQAKIRRDMGVKWENYTCADASAPTSTPIESVTWHYKGAIRDVRKMLDRDSSKIFVINDFISPEECNSIEDAAKPILHVATTADGEGGHKISEHRKAMQAGVRIPWEREVNRDPIAVLSRRVYDYTNYITGYGLEEYGQEDLMSIQYFGENYEKGEPPDRYYSHYDGDCTG